MGMKTVLFPDTEAGREMFRKLVDGVLLGSHTLRQKEPPTDKDAAKTRTRLEARIQKRYYAISTHVPMEQKPPCPTCGQPAGRVLSARDLKSGSCSVDYSTEELEHIDKLLQCVAWGGADQVAVADLYDALAEAKPVPVEGKEA